MAKFVVTDELTADRMLVERIDRKFLSAKIAVNIDSNVVALRFAANF